MKIIKLSVENYKSINSIELEKLSNINMIYGYNNSGKSNILKFIELIFGRKIPTDPATRLDASRGNFGMEPDYEKTSNFWEGIISDRPYLFHKNNIKAPIKFTIDIVANSDTLVTVPYYDKLNKIFFNDKPTDFTITIIGEIEYLSKNDSEIKLIGVLLNDQEVFNSVSNEYFQGTSTEESSELSDNGYEIIPEILSQFNDSVLLLDNDRYFTSESENAYEPELTPRSFKNWFHNLSLDSDRNEDFLEIINRISTFKANGDANFTKNESNSPIKADLSFEFARNNNRIEILLKNAVGSRLPIDQFGTGIQQVLYILAKIAEKKPKIILIEEIELNLSPKYQYELIQHILNNLITNSHVTREVFQLFFTTHSPLLCVRTDFIVYKLSINEKGETQKIKIGKNERMLIQEFYPKDVIEAIIEQKGDI